ncbi:ATP-binding protein [Crenobacter sp. SG2303]|uniref:ATP-binding protein n=1 Tax=Crenobacter oryzisoli TaxID=3056844 RepID=A0ABT7XRF5_9NEIS|nr:ATP-binding protein [Crenobacter sp. SG2303]MDN0075094.1 ATP-binding protein [Crenobacter sp. SG2303]MDN0076298.1 ATP-binding protein [Crenobacter sp. SG2303]
MNGPHPSLAWTDANQQLLVAEFERLKQRLGTEGDAQPSEFARLKQRFGLVGNALRPASALETARAAMPAPAAIDQLSDCFGLSAFERDVLLLCAGVEMDAQLAAQCTVVSGDFRRPGPTFGLALAALDEPHWSALAPVRPLRRWRLVEVEQVAGVAQGRLRIDERILHYLAGVNYLDVRLGSLLRPLTPPTVMADAHRAICDAVHNALEMTTGNGVPAVWLTGDDALGQSDVAAAVAAALGLELHALRAEDVPADHAELEAFATLWEREAVLLGGALLVGGGADVLPHAAYRLVDALRGLVFVSTSQPQPLERPALRFTINKPDAVEQKQLWQQALGDGATRLNNALDGVASQFRLSARTIQMQGAQLAPTLAADDDADTAIWAACRTMGHAKLGELAQHIEVAAGWDDLILPEAQKATLRQIGTQVKNRLTVYLEWGFADQGTRGLGISALFAGESGTGKTMAAEVLANKLQLDLYRIDLSSVVSKYIGETEKNLRRVFDAAEEGGAILLFDEADALFGKRSEVKDSHDRYANIEVSYLLQRMEAYRGLAILTSNLKTALDPAFQRRLRFVVQFPFPDQTLREAIWRRIFPARTPLNGLDYQKLARLSVAGGNIRSIALNAAFLAAEMGEPVSMAHLLQAAHHEAGKRDRPLSDTETRGWI